MPYETVYVELGATFTETTTAPSTTSTNNNSYQNLLGQSVFVGMGNTLNNIAYWTVSPSTPFDVFYIPLDFINFVPSPGGAVEYGVFNANIIGISFTQPSNFNKDSNTNIYYFGGKPEPDSQI